jgi:hypothetical protein
MMPVGTPAQQHRRRGYAREKSVAWTRKRAAVGPLIGQSARAQSDRWQLLIEWMHLRILEVYVANLQHEL